jgi:hypothetical protein
MTIEVIGAGFGRTGTLSLKLALEQLGYDKCYHMMEIFGHPEHVALWHAATRGEPMDWDALYQGYRATVDWPECAFWAEQMHHFPDAKVVLTERDPERWHDSVMNTIYPSSLAQQASDDPGAQAWAAMAFELIWDGTFHGRIEDRDYAIGIYREHNDRVKREVPADRLLVFEASQGWAPLCEFLGRAVPQTDFPRVNTTEEFQARAPRSARDARG